MNIPDGWPTEEMMREGLDAYMRATKNLHLSMGEAFKAMFAVAPPMQDEPVGLRWRRNKNFGWKYNRIAILKEQELEESGYEYELLYTCPQSDKLRQAAEELTGAFFSKPHSMYITAELIMGLEKLCSALEEK